MLTTTTYADTYESQTLGEISTCKFEHAKKMDDPPKLCVVILFLVDTISAEQV